MKRVIVFFAIVVPAIGLLYFGLSRDPRVLPSALVGQRAPAFALPLLNGDAAAPIALQALHGKPLVLNFWSTWCGTCAQEHQVLRQLQRIYAAQGVQLYSVLYSDTAANATRFLQQFGEAAPVLLDPELRTAIDYGVSGVPETYFIDAHGIVRHKHAGALTPDVAAARIEELLHE
ncbi:MAG: redoxin family protein [Deltaproteobacteria bacterium]|nr:redoxin family protein [Deltaproteobacteria bacterium]